LLFREEVVSEARVFALVLNSGVLGEEEGGRGDAGDETGKELMDGERFIDGERFMDRSDW
jgi:hypothetical protein